LDALSLAELLGVALAEPQTEKAFGLVAEVERNALVVDGHN
jgi:hypothetical protein